MRNYVPPREEILNERYQGAIALYKSIIVKEQDDRAKFYLRKLIADA